MKNRGFLKLAVLSFVAGVITLISSIDTSAQGRYVGQYSKRDVSNIISRMEDSSDQFRNDFRQQMDNSRFSSSDRDRFNRTVANFENAVDRLRNRFDREDSWWESRSEVQAMVRQASPVNSMMNTISFRRNLERQWNRLRNDVNTVADTYDLPGINGGGWSGGGGGWGGGGGTMRPPNWAQGTWYGTAPDGSRIVLTISANGSVNANINGSMSYGTYVQGNAINVNGAVARVSRSGGGIVTVRTDNGERINYRRNNDGNWNDGGGWAGGNQISPPNWARGNFVGTAPDGSRIDLRITNNGEVTARIGNGGYVYGSYTSGNYITIDGAVSRVARSGNGITTTRLDNGERLVYRRQ